MSDPAPDDLTDTKRCFFAINWVRAGISEQQWLAQQKLLRGMEDASDDALFNRLLGERQAIFQKLKQDRGMEGASDEELFRVLAKEEEHRRLDAQKRERNMEGASEAELFAQLAHEQLARTEITHVKGLRRLQIEHNRKVNARSEILRLRSETGAPLVLVVEANSLNTALFTDLLKARGYLSISTSFPRQAFRLARLYKPEVIQLDWQLPDVSGLELAKWLRQDARTAQIPLICCTAFAMKGDEERIRQARFDACLAKPISVPCYINVIESLLNAIPSRITSKRRNASVPGSDPTEARQHHPHPNPPPSRGSASRAR